MKLQTAAILCLLVLTGVGYAADDLTLSTQKDKVSYIIGTQLGNNIKRQPIEVDADIVTKGLKDALSGAKPRLTDQQISEVMAASMREILDKRRLVADRNKKDGEAFLAENKKRAGVTVLPDGLQYKVIKAGTGTSPKSTDTVMVNYRGAFIDGTDFDSSYKRGQPATFPLSAAMRGWVEALQLMKTGSKWELFVPSELGYGEQGNGPVGPNMTLVFDIELLSVNEGK